MYVYQKKLHSMDLNRQRRPYSRLQLGERWIQPLWNKCRKPFKHWGELVGKDWSMLGRKLVNVIRLAVLTDWHLAKLGSSLPTETRRYGGHFSWWKITLHFKGITTRSLRKTFLSHETGKSWETKLCLERTETEFTSFVFVFILKEMF